MQVRITNLSVNATSYSWDFGDGFRIEGPVTPSHTYTTPGKKVITLYSQGYNNLKGIYKDSIIIEESSAVMEADVLTGCTGQVVNLRADAVNTSSYLWDFGDGTVKETTSDPFYKHTYLSAGVFTPKIMVRNAKGCGHTAGIPEKIIIDSLSVSVSSISEHLCQFTDNIFTPVVYSVAENAAGETLTYKWDYGTGMHGSFSKEGAFTYNRHGTYTIGLTVSSPYGCVKEDSRQVVVHEKFGLELEAPSQLDVCKHNSVPVRVKGGYSYEWINHTEGLSNTQIGNPLARPETDAVYTVVGYDRWKCSSDTAQIEITVRPLPAVNAGPDAEVVANTEHQLQAAGSDDVIQWAWTPADYLSCTNCIAPVSRPKRTMEYVLTGNTQYNCISRDTVLIKSLCLNGFIYIPNSFTPNGDGKNDRFYIKGKGIGNIRLLQVFNRWGDKVFERKHFDIDDPSAGWDGTQNGRPVSPGSYVYMAEMRCVEDGAVIVKRGTVTVIY